MKKIKMNLHMITFEIFVLLLVSVIAFSGCDGKGTTDSNQWPDQLQQPTQVVINNSDDNRKTEISNKKAEQIQATQADKNDMNDKKENLSRFFFKDISSKKQYIYEGTAWDQNILLKEKPEEVDSEGRIKVKAKLDISEIAKLSKGKIYEFKFTVDCKIDIKEKSSEKFYLWVTEDKIYDCVFSNSDDAIKMEKNGQLPKADREMIRCSESGVKFTDADNPLTQTEISVENNICLYRWSHNNGHFKKFVWKVNKGLAEYSWGYGAMRDGMDLKLVE